MSILTKVTALATAAHPALARGFEYGGAGMERTCGR
jgi:hypothetical protein